MPNKIILAANAKTTPYRRKTKPPMKIPRGYRVMAGDTPLRIRKAKTSDINSIAAIDAQRFAHPWKNHYFTAELSHDISFFYVAEDVRSTSLAGYIIFWIIEETLELHKIAAADEYKKKGIGKELFQFMLEIAKQKKVKEIFLEVRKSNTEAIKFYESFHFKFVSIRKDYYSDPREDALVYRLDTFFKR